MQRQRERIILAGLLLTLAVGPPAWAESHPGARRTPPTVRSSSRPQCPPDVGPQAPTVGSGQRSGNLSNQLARSGGVICPPATADPGMAVPPKDTGRMPVIPPPGTPGGNQQVQPK